MINEAVMRGYKVMDVLTTCQKLKMLWHFAILTWDSMGMVPDNSRITHPSFPYLKETIEYFLVHRDWLILVYCSWLINMLHASKVVG